MTPLNWEIRSGIALVGPSSTPNRVAGYRAPNGFQLRPNARGWLHYMVSPQDLMLQLFSLQRQGTSPDRNGENSSAGRDLLELILTFDANNDGSSDEGRDNSSAEDCFE